MARKSRKIKVAEPVREVFWQAAVYIRLSVEDNKTGTISIETQRMIIDRFLEHNPEISVYHTYIDNGATGTNFHRPGFQQMLSDIETGKVNCVIVKDYCAIIGLNQKDLANQGVSGLVPSFLT